MAETAIVYGNSISPFVRKVLVFGAEKGIALTLSRAGMGQGGPDFAEASPFGTMPAFRDPGADDGKDYCLADSSAIVTYLDAKHPDMPLIPAAPMARGRTIWFDEYADTILFAAAAPIFFNRVVLPLFLRAPGDEAAAAKAEAEAVPRAMDYLETQVTASGHLVEERLTLADIAVASPFVNLAHAGWTVDAVRWPGVARFVSGILARPSFAGIVAQEQGFVAKARAAVQAAMA